jgi:hypothetical protein
MDFYLDPTTHDLDVSGFDIKTTPDTTAALLQRLKVKLMFFKGEWFLNTNFGVPYFQEIFVSANAKDDADTAFKLAITQMQGVERLLKFSSTYNNTTREFLIDFSVQFNGEVITTSLLI